jgi:hypothetical protein
MTEAVHSFEIMPFLQTAIKVNPVVVQQICAPFKN